MRAVLVALAAAATCVGASDVLLQHSFAPPFTEFDSFGKRMVSYWEAAGHAFVNKHFVRLTPDRQSKRGYMWNNQPFQAQDWSVLLEFRVSGQGRTLFGDGFVLWLTKSPRFVEGPMFGVVDRFVGLGLVFDTFRNSEVAHVHKDISVFVSNGTSAMLEHPEVNRPGCNANFRYHEGRDDFSVENVSRVKMTYKGGALTVRVDEQARGQWRECARIEQFPLPADWARGNYFGLSASTGQLADNHDVLRMLVTSLGPQDMDGPDQFPAAEAKEEKEGEVKDLPSLVEKFVRKHVKGVSEELEKLQHSLEHQLTAVDDNTKSMIQKLQKQEDASKARITELEQRVNEMMEQRLRALEEGMRTRIEEKAGRWMIPFVVFAVVVGVVVFFAYRKYNYLMKTHML